MHADDAVRALRRVRHLCDAQGGSVRREDDFRRAEPVQFRIEFPFDVHLLEHRLDHDVSTGHGVLEIDDAANLPQDAVHLGGGHLSLLDTFRERLADPPEAAVHEALLDVPHRDLEAGRGARLRDSAPIVPAPITAILRTSARPMAPPAAAEYPCGPKECVT